MAITMYSASVPRLAAALRNLDHILSKGEAHAIDRKIDPGVLLGSRLFPDMFPLVRQVQIACDMAKGAAARLAGIDVPRHEDTEQSFAELRGRVAKVLAFLESVPAASIEGSEGRRIVVPQRGGEVQFTGEQYLCGFVLPNVHFHITTAYNILRHNGVELGKRDFIGNP